MIYIATAYHKDTHKKYFRYFIKPDLKRLLEAYKMGYRNFCIISENV